MKNAIACCLAAALFGAADASAQAAFRFGAGAGYETFNFDNPTAAGIENVSLLTVPLAASVRISSAFTLELRSAWASGRLTLDDGTETTLSGPTDTEVRAVVAVGRDLVTLTGIALLPTGTTSLTFEEADLAGIISADLLPFRISNWGTGGGAGVSAAIVRPIGEFAAGLSVGYVVASDFEPLGDDPFTYRPGNQLSVRAALDRTIGNSGKAALVLSMQRYADDEVEGVNLFRTGARYEAVGSYAFAAGATGAAILYAGLLHRDESEFLDVPDILPAQDLLFVGGGLELRTGSLLLRPAVDVRVLRRDGGTDQGYTSSAGGDLEIPFANATIVPSIRARFGNLTLRENAESGFTGFDAAVAVRFGAGATR